MFKPQTTFYYDEKRGGRPIDPDWECANWTQIQSVGGLSLEQCDEHRWEYRINDEYIVSLILPDNAEDSLVMSTRAKLLFEWQMMVKTYPLWIAGESIDRLSPDIKQGLVAASISQMPPREAAYALGADPPA